MTIVATHLANQFSVAFASIVEASAAVVSTSIFSPSIATSDLVGRLGC